jgi:hypothetical protein
MQHPFSTRTGTWPATLTLLLIFAGFSGWSFARQHVVTHHTIAVSTDLFTLQREGDNFFLQPLPLSPKHPRISIPKDWLVPPHQSNDDEDTSPVNPFNYDHRVTSFPIGNAQIGLHFSSFDAMTDGSMAAAEGRDVFLIYDPSEGKLRPGGFDLGITKERYRVHGCFRAQMVHLMIADINEDGLTDIGAVKEEIWCPEIGEDEDEVSDGQPAQHKKLPPELENVVERHLYQQHIASWYIYTPQGWKLDTDRTWMPDTFSDLPLIGITLSPVDFVGEVIWHSFDPKSWVDQPLYVPRYRRKLIVEHRPRFRNSRNPLKLENDQRSPLPRATHK